jgi:hypothetical protein
MHMFSCAFSQPFSTNNCGILFCLFSRNLTCGCLSAGRCCILQSFEITLGGKRDVVGLCESSIGASACTIYRFSLNLMPPSRVCLLLGLSEVHGLVMWPGIVKTRMFLLKDQS